jgi:hypothetical protein
MLHARHTPARIIFLFVLLLSATCNTKGKRVDFSADNFSLTATAYPKVTRLWTEKKEFYRNPSRVFVEAVYSSWQWREAKIALLSKNRSNNQQEASILREKERSEYNEYHEFFIKFYTDPRKLNDLHMDKTQWRVSISDNRGNEITAAPADFVKLSEGTRNLSNDDRQLYDPILDEFSIYYRIRFPRKLLDGTPLEPTGPGGRLTLRFSSPLTKIELNWISK